MGNAGRNGYNIAEVVIAVPIGGIRRIPGAKHQSRLTGAFLRTDLLHSAQLPVSITAPCVNSAVLGQGQGESAARGHCHDTAHDLKSTIRLSHGYCDRRILLSFVLSAQRLGSAVAPSVNLTFTCQGQGMVLSGGDHRHCRLGIRLIGILTAQVIDPADVQLCHSKVNIAHRAHGRGVNNGLPLALHDQALRRLVIYSDPVVQHVDRLKFKPGLLICQQFRHNRNDIVVSLGLQHTVDPLFRKAPDVIDPIVCHIGALALAVEGGRDLGHLLLHRGSRFLRIIVLLLLRVLALLRLLLFLIIIGIVDGLGYRSGEANGRAKSLNALVVLHADSVIGDLSTLRKLGSGVFPVMIMLIAIRPLRGTGGFRLSGRLGRGSNLRRGRGLGLSGIFRCGSRLRLGSRLNGGSRSSLGLGAFFRSGSRLSGVLVPGLLLTLRSRSLGRRSLRNDHFGVVAVPVPGLVRILIFVLALIPVCLPVSTSFATVAVGFLGLTFVGVLPSGLPLVGILALTGLVFLIIIIFTVVGVIIFCIFHAVRLLFRLLRSLLINAIGTVVAVFLRSVVSAGLCVFCYGILLALSRAGAIAGQHVESRVYGRSPFSLSGFTIVVFRLVNVLQELIQVHAGLTFIDGQALRFGSFLENGEVIRRIGLDQAGLVELPEELLNLRRLIRNGFGPGILRTSLVRLIQQLIYGILVVPAGDGHTDCGHLTAPADHRSAYQHRRPILGRLVDRPALRFKGDLVAVILTVHSGLPDELVPDVQSGFRAGPVGQTLLFGHILDSLLLLVCQILRLVQIKPAGKEGGILIKGNTFQVLNISHVGRDLMLQLAVIETQLVVAQLKGHGDLSVGLILLGGQNGVGSQIILIRVRTGDSSRCPGGGSRSSGHSCGQNGQRHHHGQEA